MLEILRQKTKRQKDKKTKNKKQKKRKKQFFFNIQKMEIKHQDTNMCICDKCYDIYTYITLEELYILHEPFREITILKEMALIQEKNLDIEYSISRCNMLFQEVKNLITIIKNIKKHITKSS